MTIKLTATIKVQEGVLQPQQEAKFTDNVEELMYDFESAIFSWMKIHNPKRHLFYDVDVVEELPGRTQQTLEVQLPQPLQNT